VPVLLAVLLYRQDAALPLGVWEAGAVLVILGVAIRIWAQSHIHHRIGMPMFLTQTGPYQYVRNPLYLGTTLICAGAVAISRLPWMVPLTLLWCAVVYSIVVLHEERTLKERYGEPYQQYLEKVPRWFPRMRNAGRLDLVNQYTSKAVLAEVHALLLIFLFPAKGLFLDYGSIIRFGKVWPSLH